jgi:MaoC dehydratase-like protein
MTDTNISPEMHAAIGTELIRKVSHPVTDSDIRRWAIAVYWPEPAPERYLRAGDGPLVAPEEFNPFAWTLAESATNPAAVPTNGLDADFPEKRMGLTGPGLKFQLNGGIEAEYGEPIRVGDTITSVDRLASYAERDGRLGRMLFTVFEDTWTNQHGQLVKRGRNTLIRY